jgi:hypothetical protein
MQSTAFLRLYNIGRYDRFYFPSGTFRQRNGIIG